MICFRLVNDRFGGIKMNHIFFRIAEKLSNIDPPSSGADNRIRVPSGMIGFVYGFGIIFRFRYRPAVRTVGRDFGFSVIISFCIDSL